jgi:hypothetical protein
MSKPSSIAGKFPLLALPLAALTLAARDAEAAQGQSAAVEIPTTPAGEQFSSWLSDRAELENNRP